MFLQNTQTFKDYWWSILKPHSTCSLNVAISEFCIYKKLLILRSVCQSVSYTQSCQVCSIILKWLECNSWMRVFPWQQFYFMINQLLYILVIIIGMDRNSITYTHESNLRTPFIILLSCSLQLLWCYLVVPLIWCVWTSR